MNKKIIGLMLIGMPAYAGTNLSVYEINPWVDVPVLAVSAAGSIVPILYEKRLVHKRTPGSRDDVNSFDRPVIDMHSKAAAWGSHGLVTLAIGVPLFMDLKDQGWSQEFKEDFVVYAEVLSIDTSINNAVRYSVQRPRPEAYRLVPTPNDPGSYISFHAGHVASTVSALSAASMTYNYRYGPHVWPWIVTGIAGVGEGYLRSAAGKHFYTDDIVGILVGASVGTIVPILHHRKSPNSLTLVPEEGGAQLVWHRNF